MNGGIGRTPRTVLKLSHLVNSENWAFLARFYARAKAKEEVTVCGIADRNNTEGMLCRDGSVAV